WALALLTWPVTLFAALGCWLRLDPAQLESDPVLAGWLSIRCLLLPVARAALGLAAVLTFVLALNNFAVPAILQTKVFPAEIWLRFNTTFDTASALQLSWPLIVAPLLLLALFRGREWNWPDAAGQGRARALRRQLGRGWFGFCATAGTLVLALSAALPLARLLGTARTWIELPGAFAASQPAVLHSFAYAAVTATLTVVPGLWLGRRWRIGWLLWIFFLVPGVLLGIGLIVLLNRPPFIAFYQSAGVVVLALTVRHLALGWNGAALAMRRLDRDLTDAARLDGASRWQIFSKVQWPQIAPLVFAAWYIVYLLCLWDVETLVLVIPPGGETLALRVFNLLHYGHNAQVNALCLLLLTLAVLPLLAVVVFVRTRHFFSAQLRKNSSRVLTDAATFVLLVTALLWAGCEPPGDSTEPANEARWESGLFSRVEVIGSRGTGAGQFNKPRSLA
ncbi:MAG: ABC transporter permease subunit, partial [Pedosphaera parvula]|nr:ABC transporter permease subunit [Pedosphaera parvula]